MFERYTERARQVVVFAQDEALALRHGSIASEHLLLGLLCVEEGLAARVLRSLGLAIDDARAEVARSFGEGERAPIGQIPFTEDAKKVMELALREALSLGHNYVGTEHLLPGLVRNADCGGAKIAVRLGADADKVRNEVIRPLSAPGRRPGRAPDVSPGAGRPLFKQFTQRARVVVLAQDESRALKHNYLGTEHLLLGLLREEEGVAARVLETLHVRLEEVRARVEEIIGRGDGLTTGMIPFTPRAKKVPELAAREADSNGQR